MKHFVIGEPHLGNASKTRNQWWSSESERNPIPIVENQKFSIGPNLGSHSNKNISDVTRLGVIRCRKPDDRPNSQIYHTIMLIGRDTILLR